MARRKKAARTKGDAPNRAAAAVGPVERTPAPPRNTAVGLPLFDLHGGPYDGFDTGAAEISVLYFPTEIHAQGEKGFGRYRITGREKAEYVPEEG